MFKTLKNENEEVVAIFIEGERCDVVPNISVAAAILSTGRVTTRLSAVSDVPRGPFCMMGICFDCLSEIDGVENQRACQIAVKEGMVVKLQQGVRKVSKDA
jgi:predicted molibdopterin-dependent oxidoreductase YjgC